MTTGTPLEWLSITHQIWDLTIRELFTLFNHTYYFRLKKKSKHAVQWLKTSYESNTWQINHSLRKNDWQNICISRTIAAIVSSIAKGKFLLWQNEYNFALWLHAYWIFWCFCRITQQRICTSRCTKKLLKQPIKIISAGNHMHLLGK